MWPKQAQEIRAHQDTVDCDDYGAGLERIIITELHISKLIRPISQLVVEQYGTFRALARNDQYEMSKFLLNKEGIE